MPRLALIRLQTEADREDKMLATLKNSISIDWMLNFIFLIPSIAENQHGGTFEIGLHLHVLKAQLKHQNNLPNK